MAGPRAYYSGSQYAGTVLDGYYTAYLDSPLISAPLQLAAVKEIPEIPSNKYAMAFNGRLLAIGVDDYSNIEEWKSLSYAVSDAKEISDVFAKQGFKSRLFKNAQATKSRIIEALLKENLTSRPDDTFVLYVAGHGFTDAGGEQFIVPFNRKGKIEVISLSEIEALLESHQGKAYVILDNCSEQLLDIDLSSRYKHMLTSNGLGKNRNELSQNKLLINENKNPLIIISSSPGQEAFESSSLQSGIATYKLLEYLKNNRDKQNIDFKEMFEYIKKQTSMLAKSKQIPQNPKVYIKRDSILN
jgi:uncharacterized caspase-like protein